jgi:hypothetical protein
MLFVLAVRTPSAVNSGIYGIDFVYLLLTVITSLLLILTSLIVFPLSFSDNSF